MGDHARIALDDAPPVLLTRQATKLRPVPAVHLVRGREAIVAMSGMLAELCRRTGQTGNMDSLEYFLGMPVTMRKTPYLVLVGLRPGVAPAAASADDLQGALLLHEYRFARWGAQVFATDERTGRRTLIAPPEIRTRVAETACRALIERGAVAVLVTLEGGREAQRTPQGEAVEPECWMATRTRVAPGYLPLAKTFDETLANMGRHTRRNLRYYRRRLEADLGVTFFPDAEIDLKTFLEVNRTSTLPIPKKAAAAQYKEMARLTNGLLAGVRSPDGRWLSLIGGRRHEGATEIDWQMNYAGLPRYSLSTVMRSYLLEHEIARGTARLIFEHGTPHSMRHSFVTPTVVDILVRRRSLREWALRRFADWIFPEQNFLRSALWDKNLVWTRW